MTVKKRSPQAKLEDAPVTSGVKVISERQGCDAPLRIGVSHIGQPLCIAGRVFERGLGAHADSDIRIVSDLPLRGFRGAVGFDDNPIVRTQSSLPQLVFSVEAGGKVLWSSAPLRLGDPAQQADVGLDGVSELHLRVRASSGQQLSREYYAQADWVDPEVELANGVRFPLGGSLPASGKPQAAAPSSRHKGTSTSEFPAGDREVIRRLAEQVAAIASLPVQKQTIKEWKRLNGLRHGKPLVLVYLAECPLNEIDLQGELILQTTNPFCRQIERELRMRLFQWKHVRGDMVMEPVFYTPYVIHDSGCGIAAQEDILVGDPANNIVAHRYHPQLRNEADLEKIRPPTVFCDLEMTEKNGAAARDLLGGVLTVETRGSPVHALAPVDELFVWMGIEEAMLCLAARPELFHLAMERLTAAHLHRLEQFKALNLFTASFGDARTTSGGLAYTDELPRKGSDPRHPQLTDLWCGGLAQIFTSVSPDMHEEFALAYEKRVLNQFGLVSYGCCEALHQKIHILRKHIPKLRKVAVTPWADVDVAVANIGDQLVFTRKPNPALLAADHWNLDAVRKEFREFLAKTRGCIVEVVLKDLSTVKHEPQRLFQWAQMATEETAKFA